MEKSTDLIYNINVQTKKLTDFCYAYHCWSESDINEHLPILKKYADECNHITEFGVRTGVSTWAWLASKALTIRSYDVVDVSKNIVNHFKSAKENEKDFSFKQISTLDASLIIEPTDLLFIDTEHTYDQCSKELKQHSNKVKKYIIFHDTVLYGPNQLLKAIDEFVLNNLNWIRHEVYSNNNGLTILKKI